jgi:tRNA nucleotidyltransferase (CCA-adding enzyme)
MVKAVTLLNRPVAKAFDASDARYRGNLIPALADSSVSPKAPMALLIRQPCISSPHLGLSLPLCLLWAMVQDLSRMNNGTLDNGSVYVDFFCQLQEYQLLERVYEKPLLDGKEILAALEIKKASKDVQTIMKSVEAWQFSRDISAEEREKAKMECKNWLKEEWAKGGIIPMKRRVA